MATVAMIICAIALLFLALFLLRIRWLVRRVGSFECARQDRRDWKGWTSGIAVYDADEIRWFRTVSLSPWPAAAWSRSDLVIADRRYRDGGKPSERSYVEVTFSYGPDPLVLAMTGSAYAGLSSWLEAAPPSGRVLT